MTNAYGMIALKSTLHATNRIALIADSMFRTILQKVQKFAALNFLFRKSHNEFRTKVLDIKYEGILSGRLLLPLTFAPIISGR